MTYLSVLTFSCTQRPITLNGGMKMTGWFDIMSLDRLKMREDKAGLEDALRCSSDFATHAISHPLPLQKSAKPCSSNLCQAII